MKNKLIMKKNSDLIFSALPTALAFIISLSNSSAQIANGYPNDLGIESNSSVIFTEMFEGSVTSLTSSTDWTTVSPYPANINPDPSVPANSTGLQSLRLTTLDDDLTPHENTLIYKLLPTDITDSVFIRYYVKYDSNTIYHHSGLWVGGKNPPSAIPGNLGGVLPSGDTEFHVGTEIRGAATGAPSTNSLFGFYTYWMGMHPLTTPPYAGQYYGNEFLNNTTADNIDLESWNCIELMVKLNNPVTASNGELKLWINGVLISNLGYQFPDGTWDENTFIEGSGAPFEGFQFRNDPALNLNYIWLRNFSDGNSPGHNGNIYFDHLVVAKNYIGPIYNETAEVSSTNQKKCEIFPNPAQSQFLVQLDQELSKATICIYNVTGDLVWQQQNMVGSKFLIAPELADGIYYIKVFSDTFSASQKIVFQN